MGLVGASGALKFISLLAELHLMTILAKALGRTVNFRIFSKPGLLPLAAGATSGLALSKKQHTWQQVTNLIKATHS